MSYTTTAATFMVNELPTLLGAGLPPEQSPGIVEFELSGEGGGQYWVDFDTGAVTQAEVQPHCIVRAAALDFMALVEGRMSSADGVMTGRLRVSGEGHRLGRLFAALEAGATARLH